jgi:hypothetical protein
VPSALAEIESMPKRLNGWQRLGVVFSVMWIILATVSYWIEINSHPSFLSQSTPWYISSFLFEWIDDPEATAKERAENPTMADSFIFLRPTFTVVGFSSLVFAPVVASWLLSYLSIWTVEWVKSGFSGDKPR